MARSYKWQPQKGSRHAIPHELTVNEVGETLCGVEVTAGLDEWPDEARYWPTCPACDLAWRAHEGIMPWPRTGKSAEKLSTSRSTASAASGDGESLDIIALVIDTLVSQTGADNPLSALADSEFERVTK